MENFIANVPDFITAASYIIAAAAAVTALFPTPRTDKFLGKARKVVNFLALNFGHAKNLEDEEKKREKLG